MVRKASYSLGPNIFSRERTSHEPIAMFARQRSSELEHQVRDVIGDRFEGGDALRRF